MMTRTKKSSKNGLPAAAVLPGGAAQEIKKLDAQLAYIDIMLAHIAAARKAGK